jgi:uncharacterized protein (TIGR00303 family)
MNDAIKCYGSSKILPQIEGKDSLFLCVMASTATSRIPGITGAGATPELTDYTPAADMELVVCGEPRCLPEIPQTVVDGAPAPTPAVITKAALELGNIPLLVVDAGAAVKPNLPYLKLNDKPGGNIGTGKAVSNSEAIFKRGKLLGETISKLTGHIVIGESTPAGTTTALGVLTAMGYDVDHKISGSTPENPHDMKHELVDEGMNAAGFKAGEMRSEPFKAVDAVGDPMIPAVAGIAAGSSVPVTLAGGTQMMAVCAVLKSAVPEFDFDKLAVATTVFVAEDETSDINHISRQISNVPVFAVDPAFEKSTNPGLKSYTTGFVKEGAGAGGAMMAAILKGVPVDAIVRKTEDICKDIF